MLPGAGMARIARRRRVHYLGDAAATSSEEEHAHHYGHSYYAHHATSSTTGVAGPALAARIRLDEKLRGAALPSRLMRDGRAPTSPRHPQITRRDEQDALPATDDAEPEPWRPAAAPLLLQEAASASASASSPASKQRRRAELTRTLSKVEVCAVCLDEVRPAAERRQRQRAVTRLPCSHKYHSECVLPWLAVHPDCPCCRALVPSADALVQVGDS